MRYSQLAPSCILKSLNKYRHLFEHEKLYHLVSKGVVGVTNRTK